MTYVDVAVGAAIKRRRRMRGVSRAELAERANVTPSLVATTEAGHRTIHLQDLAKFQLALGEKNLANLWPVPELDCAAEATDQEIAAILAWHSQQVPRYDLAERIVAKSAKFCGVPFDDALTRTNAPSLLARMVAAKCASEHGIPMPLLARLMYWSEAAVNNALARAEGRKDVGELVKKVRRAI